MRQSNSHEFHICRQVCDQAKQICKIIHSIHRIQASSCSHKLQFAKVAVVRHIFPAKVQFDTICVMPCLLPDQWQPKGMHDLP